MYLMLTAIIVFVGVWSFMMFVDAKIKRLRDEMREDGLEKDES